VIRALATDGDGKKVAMLGLSLANMVRMQADQPIVVDFADFDLGGTDVRPIDRIVVFDGSDPSTVDLLVRKFKLSRSED